MSINLTDPLYLMTTSDSHYYRPIAEQCGSGGKFIINLGKKFVASRFVARQGEWSLPWKHDIHPKVTMPTYDSTFSKSFEQVTDERALGIKSRINNGERFSFMYSGGIDSVTVITSLIKNLSASELKQITVCMNVDSIIESPVFWKKHIEGVFRIMDSSATKYDDLIELGVTPLSGDGGDAIFGTVFAIQMYNNYDYYLQGLSALTKTTLQNIKYRISDSEVHYSAYKDLIIRHLALPNDEAFGRILYEKYVHNIDTSAVPIHSLNDFFWWGMFSVKYLNCLMRNALAVNDRIEFRKAFETIEDWFNTTDYQQWSMNNNNNGQKISKTEVSYKFAAKEYVWDFTKDPWLRTFKIKLDSGTPFNMMQIKDHLPQNRMPWSRLGITHDFEIMYDDDPMVKSFVTEALMNFKIDWV